MLLRRAFVPLLAATVAAVPPSSLRGQGTDSTARRPVATSAAATDSADEARRWAETLTRADSVRATLLQPPPRPPRGLGEEVDRALKVVLTPVWLTLAGLGELVKLATGVVSPQEAGSVVNGVEGVGLNFDVGSIGPRSGPAIGLEFERFSPLYVEAGYSLRNSRRLGAGLEFGDLDTRGLRVGYRYAYHTQPHFWGIGPDTEPALESDFLWERHLATAEGGVPLGPAARLRAEIGFEDNRVGRGRDDGAPDVIDTFGSTEPFDLAERTRFARAGGSVTLDRRSWRTIQRRGFLARLGATAWSGVDGTDSEFYRFDAEAQSYLPLTHRHALAFRALGEMTRGEPRSRIPFTHLASLGSTHGLRGFSSHRFRDRDLAALMTEYRYEIWRDEPAGVEGFLFLDAGGVARSLGELDRVRTAYGFGTRIIKGEDLLALWYLAFSSEETRFGLKFDWPF